jgi:hypothetical protein
MASVLLVLKAEGVAAATTVALQAAAEETRRSWAVAIVTVTDVLGGAATVSGEDDLPAYRPVGIEGVPKVKQHGVDTCC